MVINIRKTAKASKKWLIRLLKVAAFVLILILLLGLRYNGVWAMKAYGLCYDINFGFARAYEYTDSSYTKVKMYNGFVFNGVLYSGLGKFELDKNGKVLDIIDNGSQVVYQADKASGDFFDNRTKVEDYDPVAVFRMFYETFKENYAFAAKYGVDFDKEYAKYSEQITADTDAATLYKYMCEMVSGLYDGHVHVSLNDKFYTPFDRDPEWISDKDKQKVVSDLITKKYVKNYSKFDDCPLRYGTLNADTGYIIMQGMGVTSLDKAGTSKDAMDKIMKELHDKKTIVIDLRFNGGGYDEASLMLAGYFTSKPYTAYKKQAYYEGNLTPLQAIKVEPCSNEKLQYTGKVIFLTSEYTMSAAETFLRAMYANPDAKDRLTSVGNKTAGFYSDAISKILPGGFEFGMSTERYYTPDGSELEGRGIYPDQYLPLSMKDAYDGIDRAFEWVLSNN